MEGPSSEDLDFSVVLIRESPDQKLGMVYIVKEPSLAVKEVKPNGLGLATITAWTHAETRRPLKELRSPSLRGDIWLR